MSEPFDVVVIGGSFAGLSAAMQVARSRRSVLVLDTGKSRNRFVTRAHGLVGFDGQLPKNILQQFRDELMAYPSVSLASLEIKQACKKRSGFELLAETGEAFLTKRVILSFGIVDRLPDVPGLPELWGKQVFHCPYCNGYEARDQRLGVLATQPSSLEQATMLLEWSSKVNLFTNEILPLDGSERQQVLDQGIVINDTKVASLETAGDHLTAVSLTDGSSVQTDTLFTLTNTTLSNNLAEQLGCDIEEGPFGPFISVDPYNQETSISGVYAAGDITRSFHKLSFAIADGNLAGVSAHKSLVMG
ncbi:MAG: NAD(P)/FAD-dependent oxidoreductase [Verrucomicrobiota bacterium]